MSKITNKAARLLLLARLKAAGVLEKTSLRDIGAVLGIEASTVLRSLRDLEAVEAEYERLMAEQPWIAWMTSTEFADAIGVQDETVRRMAHDGLLKARKVDEESSKSHWLIAADEVQRFK